MTGTGALPLIRAALQSAPAISPASLAPGYRFLADFEVASWSVVSTHARPNAGVSTVYRVNLEKRGQRVQVLAVASTEKVARGRARALRADPAAIAPEAGEVDPIPISVWTLPLDPALPGLAWASDANAVGAQLGLSNPRLKTVVYRPTRRAVVRVSEGKTPRAWIKVLRPEGEEALRNVLAALEGSSFPYARELEVAAPGVVVQRHGEGTPLANLISREPHRAAKMFPQIKGVLDDLPGEVAQLPRHSTWTDRREHYASAFSASFPDLEPAARRLVRTIDRLLSPGGQLVPTHGDLFEANLLTQDGRISTVLDLDSLGPGTRADDYACLLAHVSVLPFLSPSRWVEAKPTEPWRTRLDQFLPGKRCASYPESETVLEAWRLFAQREVDPADLYARCAAVTLSLAASTSLEFGEEEARARFARAQWWASLAEEHA
ncbi:MAG: phosphotransferase [Actinomycetaceae bacterium]|nr:phosphotransferase [Actinomycetaceae bacterium]